MGFSHVSCDKNTTYDYNIKALREVGQLSDE